MNTSSDPSKSQSTALSAAGRTLSQVNAERLSKAFTEIGKTLIAAGVLDLNTAYNLLKDEISAEAEISAAIDEGNFKQQVEIAAWTDRFRRIIAAFKNQFLILHNLPDESLARFHKDKSLTRDERITNLIQDLKDLLTDLSATIPAKGEDAYWLPRSSHYSDFEMKALDPEKESINDSVEPAIEPVVEPETEIKTDGESELEIAFECPTVVADIAASASNRYPVKGVLFRIDEPSEAIPAIGTGLPLYIPKEVAVTLLDKVNGLPLDADDSLTRHANKEIAGVIQSAEIGGEDNRDFCIQGILWPWNQKEKVEAISAASSDNKLGMSMNAKALGHKAIVAGKQVFWIDDIELLGANILYSECATYRKTKLLAAQGVTVIELPGSSIAAQAIDDPISNSSQGEDKPVDTNIANIQSQLTSLITSVDAMTKQSQVQFEALNSGYSELKASVAEIQAERQQQKEEFQLQKQQQEQKQQQDNLISSLVEQISAAVNTQVDEKLKKLKKPSGQPARLTTPLAASSTAALPMPSELHRIELQIASINGRLEEASNDMSRTMKLMDEKRQLEYQKQLLASS